MSSEVERSVDSPGRDSGSFVLDLNTTSMLVSATRCLLHAPIGPAVSTRTGAVSLGFVVSLLDIAASEPALSSCRPDWTATQDLSVHASGWLVDGPVVVDTKLLRVGKKTISVSASVYDGHGVDDLDQLRRSIDAGRSLVSHDDPTLVAKGLLTFARIPGSSAAGMADYDPAKWLGMIRRRTPDRPPTETLEARMQVHVVDAAAGVLELARRHFVTNSIGTIFGGAQATLLQLAAEGMRPGLSATDMQLHYLAQLKVGPVRTLGCVLRDARDHSVVSVELRDAGHDDQLLALATITLQPMKT